MNAKMIAAVLLFSLGAVAPSAEVCAASVSWVDECSGDWSIDPTNPTTEDVIHFSSPFIGDYTNPCFADMGEGIPSIDIDMVQRKVELSLQAQPPGVCPWIWDPVCGLKGEFGPLQAGDWVFFSGEDVFDFSTPFEVTEAWSPLTIHVDDDAPSDPGHNDPLVSDPLEDGSIDHPFDTIQEAIDAASDCRFGQRRLPPQVRVRPVGSHGQRWLWRLCA